MEITLPYTICFIQRNEKILMLHRNKEPNKGLWNGVGGKIEPGETAKDACIREVREETGLRVKNLKFRGIVTFNGTSGMYVYTAESSSAEVVPSVEGDLEWKSLLWLMTAEDVTPTVPYFLPDVLGANPPAEHAFTFGHASAIAGAVASYELRALPAEISANTF